MTAAGAPLPGWRRLGGPAGRFGCALLVLAGGAGPWPRLAVAQAVLTALLTMALGALAVVDVDGRRAWHRGLRRVARPVRGFLLFGAATFAVQMPPAVTALAAGGPLALVALSLLALAAMVFWTSVVAPSPALGGLAAGGYVVLGGVPIGVPPLLLVMLPRDVYPQLHHLYPSALDPLTDQRLAGFVLLATVKVAILTAFSILFFSAAAEDAAGGGDGGSGEAPAPGLPGWAAGLGPGSPSVPEPGTHTPAGLPRV